MCIRDRSKRCSTSSTAPTMDPSTQANWEHFSSDYLIHYHHLRVIISRLWSNWVYLSMMYFDEIWIFYVKSIVVEFRIKFVKIVGLWQPLVRSWSFQKVNIVLRIVLAISKLIDFLFASEKVGISLEKTLFKVIIDGQTKRFNLHSTSISRYALLL